MKLETGGMGGIDSPSFGPRDVQFNGERFSEPGRRRTTKSSDAVEKEMHLWAIQLSKAMINFDSLIPVLQEYIKFTTQSDDKSHTFVRSTGLTSSEINRSPLYEAGQEVKEFLEKNADNFDKFFSKDLPAQKACMNYLHETYKVPLCEFCGNEACKCRGNLDLITFVQSIRKKSHHMKFNAACVMEFEKVESFLAGNSSKQEIAKVLPSFEKKLFAMKRYYFWQLEMKNKELKVKSLVKTILNKRKAANPKPNKPPKDFTEFENVVCVCHDLAKDLGDPNGMNPTMSAWYNSIPGHDTLDKKDEKVYNEYIKDIYPELIGASKAKKELAQKHVFQYYLRYELIGPQFLFEFFYFEQRIQRAKQLIGSSEDEKFVSDPLQFLCDPTEHYELLTETFEESVLQRNQENIPPEKSKSKGNSGAKKRRNRKKNK